MSAIHIQVDNMTTLTYLLKMGGTKNPELMQTSKEIFGFLLGQGITFAAERLPGNLNCQVGWESRYQKDSSEWKLCPLVFNKICRILRKKPEMTCLFQSCQINFQVIILESQISTILVQMLFNRKGITRVYMHSLHFP